MTLALIVVVLGGCALVYYAYVSSQKEYFTERNFRVLSTINETITEEFLNYGKVFGSIIHPCRKPTPLVHENLNFIPPYEGCLSDDELELKTKLEAKDFQILYENNLEGNNIKIRKTAESIPEVLKWEIKKTSGKAKVLEDSRSEDLMPSSEGLMPSSEDLMPSAVKFESRLTGPVAIIDFSYKNRNPSDPPLVKVQMDLKRILDQLVETKVFAHFILADEKGNVIFHKKTMDANSNLTFTTLDVLFKQEKPANGIFSIGNAEQNDSHEETTIDFKFSASPKDGHSDRRPSVDNYLDKLPVFHEVKLGDREYILFAQPGAWGHIKDDRKNIPYFILAGLVSAERFRNDTQAIPNPLLLLIVFFLFAIFFCLPLLKLFSMVDENHVSLLDVLGLMFSSLMLTGLLTVSCLDFFIIHQTQDRIDENLKATALQVKSNFFDELKTAIRHLWMFDDGKLFKSDLAFAEKESDYRRNRDDLRSKEFLKGHLFLGGALPPGGRLPVDLSSISKAPFKSVRTEIRREMAENLSSLYPIKFKEVFWVNDDGWERVTWSVEKNTPQNSSYRQINLSDRKYFKRIKENKPWRLASSEPSNLPSFFLQPIYSWTTGENRVILSIPSSHTSKIYRKPDEKSDEKPLVAALDFSFDSLMPTIVPSGFGFAVINSSEEKVLFHSDSQRNLRENFIRETDQNARLLSLLYSRGSGHFDGRYLGEERRFYISPLNSDVPWSLVVYHDKAVLQTLNRETLFVFVTLFFLYAFLILGFGLFGLLIFGTLQRGQGDWMWPAPNRGTTYLLVFLGQVLLVFFFLWTSGKGDVTLLSAFVLPLLGIALMFILLADKKSRISKWIENLDKKLNRWGKFPGYRRNYTFMVLGFMLLYSAVPTFAFFTVAFDQEMKLHTMHSLHGLARAWDQHTEFLSERKTKEGENAELNDNDRQLAPCPQSSNATYAFLNLTPYSLKLCSGETPDSQNGGGEKVAGLPPTITTQPSSVTLDPAADSVAYDVMVTNGVGTVTTAPATLTVQPMRGEFIDWFHLKMRIFSNLIAIETGSYLPSLERPSPLPGWTWSPNSNEPRPIILSKPLPARDDVQIHCVCPNLKSSLARGIETGSYLQMTSLETPSLLLDLACSWGFEKANPMVLSKSFPTGEVVQISGLSPNSKNFLAPYYWGILVLPLVIGALYFVRKHPQSLPTVVLGVIVFVVSYLTLLGLGIWVLGKTNHKAVDPFLFWGAVSFIVYLIYKVIQYISRRVFLLDFQNPPDLPVCCWLHKTQLVLVSPLTDSTPFKNGAPYCEVIDLHTLTEEGWWAKRYELEKKFSLDNPPWPPKTIVFNHLESQLGSPECFRKMIALLDRLLSMPNLRICLVSTLDPKEIDPEWLTNPDQKRGSPQPNSEDRSKCLRVLQSFVRVYWQEPKFVNYAEMLSTRHPNKKLVDEVKKECDASLYLQAIGVTFLQMALHDYERFLEKFGILNPDWKATDEFYETIGEMAHCYYQAIWESCSQSEKLTLFHLAKYGFLESKNRQMRMLRNKGLIVGGPYLTLLNESFKRYVLKQSQQEDIARLEELGPRSSWSVSVYPLIAGLLLIVLFLLSTQEAFRSVSLAFLSVIPALLPVLPKILSLGLGGKSATQS